MKPVLFSVSYAGLWGQATLELPEFLEKAAQLGFPAVELMAKRPHLSVLDITEESAARLADKARRLGLEISTIAAYTDFTASTAATEVPFGEMQVAYIQQLARLGRALGARIIRVFTGYMTDEASYKADWDKCVTAVRDCADAAGGEGLILGVQNHHDVAGGSAAYLEFLADVGRPNCKAMFDPWAPALQGEDLYSWAKAAAPYMVQTTLADYVRLNRYAYQPGLVNYREVPAMVRAVPLGEGFIDFDAFFRGLKEGGFDGYVAYEMCSPLRGGGSLENLDATARKSLDVIKTLI
ncbi:MAG TPA: sugar phosphate isomerase/epimerase family protein [Candidatus Bathyarchaeia archaeon]|nr:sugar phosphate isomerase/epimerase family protein [Candidatus Bathyarchaeia archaeon]